jgi:hypothetical protein
VLKKECFEELGEHLFFSDFFSLHEPFPDECYLDKEVDMTQRNSSKT